MAKIIWSPSALADIDAISEYISRDSVHHASLFVDRIIGAAQERIRSKGMQRGQAMQEDPIVDEVRKARDAHAKKFGYDLHAICVDLKRKQEGYKDRLVSLPPKQKLGATGT